MKSIAALLPRLAEGSGGLRTIVAHLQALQRQGHECHVYVEGDASEPELREALQRFFQAPSLIPHSGWNLASSHDLVLATMWHTALALGSSPVSAFKVYFAQDFEPWFHPMGGRYLLAENSYRERLDVITMGRWLAAKLQRELGLTPRPVEFGADLDIYRPLGPAARPEFAIAVAHHPGKPHRGTLTCLRALRLLHATLPTLKIFTFGSQKPPDDSLGATHLGILQPPQLNDVYNRCLAGICLSLTNPSRMPFEMMAAGLPVVEAHAENTLADLPAEGAVFARFSEEGLHAALLDLLADDAHQSALRQAGLEAMRRRPIQNEHEQFCTHVHDILHRRPPRTFSLPSRSVPATATLESRSPDRPRPWGLVTVDVWDTLLRRRCHPDEVKLHTARYLALKYASQLKAPCRDPWRLLRERVACEFTIGTQQRAAGHDDEYAIADVFQLWLATAFGRVLSPVELRQYTEELVAVELTQEARVTYADPGIRTLLDGLRTRDRRFLSDFYVPSAQLESILRTAGVLDLTPSGWVSCDTRLNKRSGRLFDYVHQKTGIAPAEHLHVGDSDYSDYFVPRKRGVVSLSHRPAAEHRRRLDLQREYASRGEDQPFCPRELKSALLPFSAIASADAPDLQAQACGAASALVYVGFALFIAEEAIKAGLSRVFFFTREGRFFRRVYQAVAAQNPLGTPFPEPVLLEVSRLSTFAASLEQGDLAEFMRIWNLYSVQSMRGFLVSIDLDPASFESLLHEHRLTLDEPIRYPWCDQRVQALVVSLDFAARLHTHVAERRQLLIDYLATRGLSPADARVGIVDIGWRGTIQDNLARVLPHTEVWGFYFGLLPFLNPQPANVRKTAFGPGRREDPAPVRALLEYVSPLEMLANCAEGSVLRYQRQGPDVTTQLDENPSETRVFDAFTRHFQEGVLSQVPVLGPILRDRSVASSELRPTLLALLDRIVHDPPRIVAEAYFGLTHNETFGVGAFDDKHRHRAQIDSARQLFFAHRFEDMESALRSTTWPQGFLRLCQLRYPFFRPAPGPREEIPLEERRTARELGRQALAAYEQGDRPEALRFALQSLAVNPYGLRIQYLTCRICLDLGLTRSALHQFRLVRLLHPKHAPTLNEFARGLAASGMTSEARSVLEEVREAHPDYTPAVLNLARLHLANRDPEAALGILARHREPLLEQPAASTQLAPFQALAAHSLMLQTAQTLETSRSPDAATLTLAPLLLPHWKKLEQQPGFIPRFQEALRAFCQPASDDAYLGLRPQHPASSPTSLPPQTAPETNEVPAEDAAESTPLLASILILVYNQLDHTQRCVASLRAHTRDPYELIFVDNGSTDGTAAYLEELAQQDPRVRVITNRGNRGFAAGNNQAIRIAQGQALVLLNNDTVVTPGWLDGLLAPFSARPDVGITGPVSNRVSGPQRVDHPNDARLEELPEFARRWTTTHRGETQEVRRVVGFCLAVRRKVVDAIGGLDEQFGSGNFEDDDFCLRAALAGFKALIAREVFIHHVGGQTFRGASIDYRHAMLRNWGLFKAKWGLPPELPLEQGYPTPAALPPQSTLRLPLPNLEATHRTTPGARSWTEHPLPPTPAPAPASAAHPGKASPLSQLGSLNAAREQLRQHAQAQAWELTLEALSTRPFHPEGLLLLAEIAADAGDNARARLCAERARSLVPGWSKPKALLKHLPHRSSPTPWRPLPEPSDPPRLTLCLITRNEERFLPQCLRSAQPIATQIVVVDTGSTDRTCDLAREFGAEVHTVPWTDDFSAARNAALEHARGDWVLFLDADEELPAEHHASLRAELQRRDVLGWRLPLVNVGLESEGHHLVPRLFRNAPGVAFRGRIHEEAFTSLEPLGRAWNLDLRPGRSLIHHHGYRPEVAQARDKTARNLRLLQRAVQEEPDHPHLWMSYGLALCQSGSSREGLDAYAQAFRLLSARQPAQVTPELRETLLLQYSTHLLADHNFELVIQVLESPLAQLAHGLTASLHFNLGLACSEMKQWAPAVIQFRAALSQRHQPGHAPQLPEIRSPAPHQCLARCLVALGRIPEAEQSLQQALAEAPQSRAVRLDWARLLHEKGESIRAIECLQQLLQEKADDPSVWLLGGRIATSRPEFLEFAEDWSREALKYLPEHPALIRLHAEVLLRRGEARQSLACWQRLPSEADASVAAAILFCQLATGAEAAPPEAARLESVSREFLALYRRLVHASSSDVIHAVNQNVPRLASLLPPAGRALEQALAASR